MELRRKDVIPINGRCEWRRIVRFGRGQLGVFGDDIVRMDEINGSPWRESGEVRSVLLDAKLIPSHVRHFEAGNVFESDNVSFEEIEPRVDAFFKAARKEQLHAKADAKEGLAAPNVFADGRGE